MAINFNNFLETDVLNETHQLVGFAHTSSGGERRCTLNTLRNSLIGNGALNTIMNSNLTPNSTLITNSIGKIVTNDNISATELNYLDGVTSSIQIQLDNITNQLEGKQNIIEGAAVTIISNVLNPNQVLVTNNDGNISESEIKTDELNTLLGIKSSVQEQFDAIETILENKENIITGAASSIVSDNLIADKILISNTDGKVTNSNIDSNMLNYLEGLSTNISEEFNKISNKINKSVPKLLPLEIANYNGTTGDMNCFFLSQDNRLFASGYGEVSFGRGTNYNIIDKGFRDITPHQLDLNIEWPTKLYKSSNGFYILTNLKNIYCTGKNTYGQLGLGDTQDRFLWEKLPLENIDWFSVNSTAGVKIHCAAISNGHLYVWGIGEQYRLGTGSTTSVLTPTRINNGSILNKTIIKSFCFGDENSPTYGGICVIDSDRTLHYVGSNLSGQGGTGNSTNILTFTKCLYGLGVTSDQFKIDKVWGAFWDGKGTIYALNTQTGHLFGSGNNSYGQLGAESTEYFKTIRGFVGGVGYVSLDSGVVEISINEAYGGSVIARMNDNTVRTWGRNVSGQCGNNSYENINYPHNPGLTDVIKVIANGSYNGYGSFYALHSDGSISCSGKNNQGQLGVGNVVDKYNTFQKMVLQKSDKVVDWQPWTNSGQSKNGILLLTDSNRLLYLGQSDYGCGGNIDGSAKVTVPRNSVILD